MNSLHTRMIRMLLAILALMLGNATVVDAKPTRAQKRARVRQRQQFIRHGLGTQKLDRAKTRKDPQLAIKALRNLRIAAHIERKVVSRKIRNAPTDQISDLLSRAQVIDGKLKQYNKWIDMFKADASGPKWNARYRRARKTQADAWVGFRTDAAIEARARKVADKLEQFEFGLIANQQTLGALGEALSGLKASLNQYGGRNAGRLVDEVAFDNGGRQLPLKQIQTNWGKMLKAPATAQYDFWQNLKP